MAEPLVCIGVIEGAFGVRGEARVRSFTDPPENLFRYGPLRDAEGAVALTPKAWRAAGEAFVVSAAEIATREAAMALRGLRLHVARAAFDAPGEDEFYAVDLIGCAAEDGDGGAVGAVTAVHDFGAGDVLEIAGVGGRTLYVAFTKAAVPEIELAQRRIVIDASATSIED